MSTENPGNWLLASSIRIIDLKLEIVGPPSTCVETLAVSLNDWRSSLHSGFFDPSIQETYNKLNETATDAIECYEPALLTNLDGKPNCSTTHTNLTDSDTTKELVYIWTSDNVEVCMTLNDKLRAQYSGSINWVFHEGCMRWWEKLEAWFVLQKVALFLLVSWSGIYSIISIHA